MMRTPVSRFLAAVWFLALATQPGLAAENQNPLPDPLLTDSRLCYVKEGDQLYAEVKTCIAEPPPLIPYAVGKNIDLKALEAKLQNIPYKKYLINGLGVFEEKIWLDGKIFFLRILPSNRARYEEGYLAVLIASMPEQVAPPPVQPPALVRHELYEIKYGLAGLIKKLVKEYYADESAKWDKTRERLILTDDEKDRTFAVTATEVHHAHIVQIMEDFDRRGDQILVEATIVKIDTDKAKALGVQLSRRSTSGRSGEDDKDFNVLDVASDFGSYSTFGGAIAYTMQGKFGDVLGLTLRTLLTNSAATVMLNPNIAIKSGGEGEFKQVTTIPQISTSATGGSSYTTRETGLTLKVGGRVIEGQLTRDEALQQVLAMYGLRSLEGRTGNDTINQIDLQFKVTDGSAGATISTPAGTFTPSNDLEVNSTRYFDDGEVIVLGGAVREERTTTERRIPLLSSIPLIGNLFKSKSSRQARSETVVFMRCSIMNDNTNLFLAARFSDARRYIPIHLGGYMNDATSSHPWAQGPLTSTIIYGTSLKNALYYAFNAELIPIVGEVQTEGAEVVRQKPKFDIMKQRIITELFKQRVRDRLLTCLQPAGGVHRDDWLNMEIIGKFLRTDAGLKEAFADIASKTGADPVHTLVFARHFGAMPDEIYRLYLNVLYGDAQKVETLQEYRALVTRLQAGTGETGVGGNRPRP